MNLNKTLRKETYMSEIENEIAEYEEMITHAIQTNNKENLRMWRIALQTAKKAKRSIANS